MDVSDLQGDTRRGDVQVDGSEDTRSGDCTKADSDEGVDSTGDTAHVDADALDTGALDSDALDTGEADTQPLDVLCGSAAATGDPPPFLSPPTLQLDPFGSAPLSALLTLQSDREVGVVVKVDDGEFAHRIEFGARAAEHSLPVLGLRPGRDHAVSVCIVDADGGSATWPDPLTVQTEPLSILPSIEVLTAEPDRMEPGVTLVDLAPPNTIATAALLMVEHNGDVVWAYLPSEDPMDTRRLANGNFLMLHLNRLHEVTLLGEVVNVWYSSRLDNVPGGIGVDSGRFHHEAYELPDGDLLLLTVEPRQFPSYPTSVLDPSAPWEAARVNDGVVVRIHRDGTVVKRWSMLDVLDPYRLGYGSLMQARNGAYDWGHSNAVVYDPRDGGVIVSLRHQDAVVKLTDGTDPQVAWILGTPANWTQPWSDKVLEGAPGLAWHYHQHSPMLIGDRVLMFDNGNFRAPPPDAVMAPADSYSGAVEFVVDEVNLTAELVWEYRPSGAARIYSPIYGDADALPLTGNVLISYGNVESVSVGGTTVASGPRILEVTHTMPPEEVFHLAIDAGATPQGWNNYRVERLPDIYPAAVATRTEVTRQ